MVDPYGFDLRDYEIIYHGETLSNGDLKILNILLISKKVEC
jgi:hypothetical protein